MRFECIRLPFCHQKSPQHFWFAINNLVTCIWTQLTHSILWVVMTNAKDTKKMNINIDASFRFHFISIDEYSLIVFTHCFAIHSAIVWPFVCINPDVWRFRNIKPIQCIMTLLKVWWPYVVFFRSFHIVHRPYTHLGLSIHSIKYENGNIR